MCYASAEGRSRDARADEVLVVRRQPHGSNWLVSPEDASTAVCLRTGTEVELLYIPEETQRRFGMPTGDNGHIQNGRLVAARCVCAQQRTKSAVEKTAGRASGSGALGADNWRSQGDQWRGRADESEVRSGKCHLNGEHRDTSMSRPALSLRLSTILPKQDDLS